MGIGSVSTVHPGNNFARDDDGTLWVGPKSYIEKMIGECERLFGEKPKAKHRSPLQDGDHPELDDSPPLDEDGIIRKCQSLIGTLQWTIALGRFNVATAVMSVSSFRVAPREGHMERFKRICGNLPLQDEGWRCANSHR